jgi:nicotinamide riboside kinase
MFDDSSLYSSAEHAQRGHALTLLTALDIPWVADVQRDGPQVREPVVRRVLQSLARASVAHTLISGTATARLESALSATRAALKLASPN